MSYDKKTIVSSELSCSLAAALLDGLFEHPDVPQQFSCSD